MEKRLLQCEDIRKYYPVGSGKKRGILRANDGITLSVFRGETLALVGESGCGKSTFGRAVLRLSPLSGGKITYFRNSEELVISEFSEQKMRPLRKELQIIFQDPYSSLNPKMTVGELIGEGIYDYSQTEKKEYILQVMKRCGLSEHFFDRYPHQFSGGQRQRVGIARALARKPGFVVCDEAVSALDVSIQSQILNLLLDLKEAEQLTYLFISHDLSVVRFVSDRIGVMYLGVIVELSETDEIFDNPFHPYTEALLSAIPTKDLNEQKKRIILEGDIPSPVNPPSGCRFHTRCRYCTEVCRKEEPELRELKSGHFAACHHPLSEE